MNNNVARTGTNHHFVTDVIILPRKQRWSLRSWTKHEEKCCNYATYAKKNLCKTNWSELLFYYKDHIIHYLKMEGSMNSRVTVTKMIDSEHRSHLFCTVILLVVLLSSVGVTKSVSSRIASITFCLADRSPISTQNFKSVPTFMNFNK